MKTGDFELYFGNVRYFIQNYKLNSGVDNLKLASKFDTFKIDPITGTTVEDGFTKLDEWMIYNELFGKQEYESFVKGFILDKYLNERASLFMPKFASIVSGKLNMDIAITYNEIVKTDFVASPKTFVVDTTVENPIVKIPCPAPEKPADGTVVNPET